ncbi:GNAT family N-acetyltransferase [Roseivivax sp. THAF30]|uniref:GNAT family N-acetyltransferase n=1 Tax=Roseivivax sp. THAF30 TaxID=2587852 RepID=UPI001268AAB3|nr:GNAT family N-acetyltransferase [Roseivivax sp. THAF30]QFT63189.1 hypothetical protein FIU91_09655 [Roseivivax sp. THAF30]
MSRSPDLVEGKVGADDRPISTAGIHLEKGRYRARQAVTPADVEAAQRMRHRAFKGGTEGIDADAYDARCLHILIETRETGALVACFRLLPLARGDQIDRSYSAQFYELSALADFNGPLVEMGRFCIAPEARDPDIQRVAWGALTAYVDEAGIELLFGCASFAGTDETAYLDAFAALKARHLAPPRWLPRIKAPKIFPFARKLARVPDMREAMRRMPPLLKTYLAMGGWVSDHAVIDEEMNTLHVFTGVEIGRIPPARKRALRAAAG